MDGRPTGNTAPVGPTTPASVVPNVSPFDTPLTVQTSGFAHHSLAQQPATPSQGVTTPLMSPHAGTAYFSSSGNSAPPAASASATVTVESVFREYIYRNCRDSLFWIEAGACHSMKLPRFSRSDTIRLVCSPFITILRHHTNFECTVSLYDILRALSPESSATEGYLHLANLLLRRR